MAESLIPQAMTSATAPAPYVASASNYYLGADPFKAFDKQTGTYWGTNNPVAGWLRIDLGSAKTATTYRITPAFTDQAPATWSFQGSNDGTAWSTLDSRSGVTWPSTAMKEFTVTTPGSYRYYRINVTANAGSIYWLRIAELDLLGAPLPNISATLAAASGVTGAARITATAAATLAAAPTVTPRATIVGRVDASASITAASDMAPNARVVHTVSTSAEFANLGGYNYHGEGEVDYEPPVAPTPARIKRAKVMRVHQSLPAPTLVDGRPV